MIAGISTSCMYPQYTEITVEQYARYGVKDIEIFFNTSSELEPSYIKEMGTLCDAYGVSVRSLHPFTSGFESFLFFSTYLRRVEDGLECYRRYFETANRLGARYVVFHGAESKYGIDDQLYLERYQMLDEEAHRAGVILAQENVARCKSGSAVFLAKMKRQLPNARFVLDMKQAIRAGEDFAQLLQLLGEAVVHLHVSDNTKTNDCLAPGEGEFDFSALPRLCSFLPQDTAAMIELYRENFNTLTQLFISYEFLRSKLMK